MAELKDYQSQFVRFLIESQAITFGDFVTKSGRPTPYFVNMGNFNSAGLLGKLAEYYASHIVAENLDRASVMFGPAYKGVPLAVSASLALLNKYGVNTGFAFDRKEVKDHGDKGKLVGHKLRDGDKVLIIEDVITAGTTLKEVVPFLRALAKVDLLGVVVAVDRCERGSAQKSATQEAEEELGLKVYPIVTIYDIISCLPEYLPDGRAVVERIGKYLDEYGVR